MLELWFRALPLSHLSESWGPRGVHGWGGPEFLQTSPPACSPTLLGETSPTSWPDESALARGWTRPQHGNHKPALVRNHSHDTTRHFGWSGSSVGENQGTMPPVISLNFDAPSANLDVISRIDLWSSQLKAS